MDLRPPPPEPAAPEPEPDSKIKKLVFGDLPLEMMVEIFKKLDPIERQKMRSVSRSWKDAISELFVIELDIRKSNYEAIIKTRSRLISLVLPDVAERLDTRFRQFDSFCSRLQKVEFRGIMLPDNVFLIIAKSEALKKLSLNRVTPTTLFKAPIRSTRGRELPETEGDSNRPNWFPRLTTLRFIPATTHRSGYAYEQGHNLLELLASMLVNGKLTKLKINPSTCDLHGSHLLTGMVVGLVQNRPYTYNLRIQDPHYLEILKRIITCNKATLRLLNVREDCLMGFSDGFALQFYPHQVDTSSTKLRVEKLTGTRGYYYRTLYLSDFGPWFDHILCAESLKNLDLKLYANEFSSRGFVQRVEEVTSYIIERNSVSLETVSLYCYSDLLAANPTMNYSRVFPNCTNLTSLTLMHSNTPYGRNCGLPTPVAYPNFTGIGQLPSSLKYFCTSFSFGIEAKGVDDLAVPNLRNLETLVWSANPWFIFHQTHSTPMSINDFQVLKSKLPALKLVELKIGNYPSANNGEPGNSQNGSIYTNQTVTPELLRMFEDNVVEQAEYPYLKLHIL